MAVDKKGENEGAGSTKEPSAAPNPKLSAKDGGLVVADRGVGVGGGRKRDKGGDAEPEKKKSDLATALQFLKSVVVEFRKISWPTRTEVLRETWSVLFLVAAITLMVLGFDWFLSHAIFQPLEQFARMHGGGIGRTGL